MTYFQYLKIFGLMSLISAIYRNFITNTFYKPCDCPIGSGARIVNNRVLAEIGAKYVVEYARDHGWMEADIKFGLKTR